MVTTETFQTRLGNVHGLPQIHLLLILCQVHQSEPYVHEALLKDLVCFDACIVSFNTPE